MARSDGPAAEFVALREEMQERFKAQQTLLSLQLTLVATIFGFAISQRGVATLLLIVPFSSYLLCGRQVAQHFAGQRIAQYTCPDAPPRPDQLHHRTSNNLRPRAPPAATHDAIDSGRLLRQVADDVIASVVIADIDLLWLYHPYDGGMDVILPSPHARDALRDRHRDWLSRHPAGL